ncbi:MAG: flavoprotein [Candidatus Nephthysia bennettiae]|uniref:Flavoprotein n=1 Tax=Candidatus Nephthysia bennettiae TaxID=3127016 RepID=A0A934N5Y1_9BACT|nr:flavoprotein [Candidatus Dormibacteraeota bacterium]MBJ7613479.1 flavoprotein [Candidatus Dormibacteraeota bacterium]PZR96348.1 MAG: flavoprotein [Candidatus Dormibacteraeota bacterium]
MDDAVVNDGRASVLYIVVCAAPPARHVHVLVAMAKQDRWDVCVIATPSARKFIDAAQLQEQTGHPIRSEYKDPGQPDILPPPDAIIIAPATFNTINKWAAGISDTLALGLITEAIGKGLPLVALPFLNIAQARHPAFDRSVHELRQAGVSVLLGPEIYPLHEPGTGSEHLGSYPWHLTLNAVGRAISPARAT